MTSIRTYGADFPIGNFCLFLVSCLLIHLAHAAEITMEPYHFRLSEQSELRFEPFKKDPYVENYNGFADNGSVYKIDLSFTSYCDTILKIPVSIPIVDPLKAKFTYQITEENAGGRRTGGCALGFLVSIHPGFSGYVLSRPASFPSNDWQNIEIDDIFEHCQKVAVPIIAHKYYNDLTPENMTPSISSIALFIRGAQKDARIVIQIKEIEIHGSVPAKTDLDKLITARMEPVTQRLETKSAAWTKQLEEARKMLDAGVLQSAEGKRIKKQLLTDSTRFARRIQDFVSRGFLRINDEIQLVSTLQKLTSASASLASVDEFFQQTDAAYIPFITNPLSDNKILPDDLTFEGACSNLVKLAAAPGEFEPASVVIRALKSLPEVLLTAEDLTHAETAALIPASAIDIKLVKCWYQAGTAWVSTEQRREQKVMVPELLLNDPNLVKVDTETEKNYLKLTFPDLQEYRWISDPQEKTEGPYKICDSNEFPVMDAPALLPVDIPANHNQQFWITIRVPENTASGIYTGRIRVSSKQQTAGVLDIRLEVRPFSLQPPCFTSSIFYRARLSKTSPGGSISSEVKSEQQLAAELKNLLEHNVTDPICYQPYKDESLIRKYLETRKSAGINMDALYWLSGLTDGKAGDMNVLRQNTGKSLELARSFGISKVFFFGIDERQGKELLEQRKAWECVKKAGGKIFTTGWMIETFGSVGDLLDVFICNGKPSGKEAEKWHSVNHRIWCYFNPQGGVENPALFRRNFGLLLWQNDYDGACVYAYQEGLGNIWNDFDGHYRDESLTYPTSNGVIDTIAWEGFREGIDDVRYVTTLLHEISIAKKSSLIEARQKIDAAEKFLGELKNADLMAMNFLQLREEISLHIIALKNSAK